MGEGGVLNNTTELTNIDRIRRGERDIYCLTEYPLGAVGGVGGDAANVAARERWGRNSTGDKTNLQVNHTLQSGLIGM